MVDREYLLIVEDESSIREVMRYALERPEREVTFAGSLHEAMQAAEEMPFDVALLDKNLPDGSGLQLAGRLRQRFTDLEWLMVTGYASLDSAIEAIELGAFAYLTKPFDLQVLRERVDAAFGKVAMQRRAGSAAAATIATLVHDLNNQLVVLQANVEPLPQSKQRAALEQATQRATETLSALSRCVGDPTALKR